VGVSGGPDSVALLHLLCATGSRPVVAHVNHRLRGRDSDRDEQFVHDLCAKWGLAFEGARVNTAQEAASRGESIEESARRMRYEFFLEAARPHRIKKILVAHNRNDQAETFLMRLLRGSGRRGLGGMKMIAPVPVPGSRAELIRPLLRIPRAEVLEHLRDNRLAYRQDRTNQERKFFRNRIRHRLISLIEREFQPAAVEIFARTAEILADEDRLIERSLPRIGTGRRIACASLLELPEGLRGRAVARWLESNDCTSPSWERIETLLCALSDPASRARRIQLSGGFGVRVHNGSLNVENHMNSRFHIQNSKRKRKGGESS
jgi:tRNA(Ile)-lysidine synthetase-like protein